MAATSLPKTFHIFYAWAEGPWHGERLAAALKNAGFAEAPLDQATILIAHSVGSYLVSPTDQNKIVILIGPPYWPGRSIASMLRQKVWDDFRLNRHRPLLWLQKLFWNITYIIIKPTMDARAWRAVHEINPFANVPARAIVIRNEEDVFATPQLADLIENRVIALTGQHDDCWHNPEPYVRLVQSEYKAA